SSMPLYLFFFSSRRRHTRFDCDWSSDVCSSDLWTRPVNGTLHLPFPGFALFPWLYSGRQVPGCQPPSQSRDDYALGTDMRWERRSEERRVGKEGRSGVEPKDWNKIVIMYEAVVR